MRSNGVTSARVGNIALTLGSPIAPLVHSGQPESPPAVSPEDDERRDLETLFLSSGADVSPFLRGRPA